MARNLNISWSKLEVWWTGGVAFAEDVCVRMLMCNPSLYGPSLMPSLRRSHGGGGDGGGFFYPMMPRPMQPPSLRSLTLMCQLEGRSRPGDVRG